MKGTKLRRYRLRKGVTRRWLRQPITWVVIVVLLVSGTGFGFWAVGPTKTVKVPLAKVSLSASSPIFTGNQKPKLTLTLPKYLKSLSELLMPSASADTTTTPVVDVTYKDGDAYVPVQTTPTDSGYDITISPNQTVRPGVYRVTVKGTTQDGQPYVEKTSFAWGVLAVNTDQATYTPGQTVNLSMAVLDSKGHTMCGLALDLLVTDPSGQQTTVPYTPAKECHGDSFVSVPDYTAQYSSTTQIGSYQIQFGLHNNTVYHINSSFEVAASPDFTVQRTGATRFNPNYVYGMHLHITANKSYKGQVVEMLPDPRFVVVDNDGAVVTKSGNQVILAWNVDWQAGHTYELGYSYHPPRQAPSFFIVGPVKLVAADGSTTYQESKGWQLAGDSAITYVKDTLADSGAPSAITLTKALTSTAGNTLIFVGGDAADTAADRYISQVKDSNLVVWTSSTRPASNPPASANTGGTITSNFIIAYLRNASAVTSVTATVTAGASIAIGFDVSEWSGIDNNQPTLGAITQGDGTTLVTSVDTAALQVNTCDKPTTDELMAQGEWFCANSDSYLVVTAGMGGNTSWTSNTGGWSQLTTVLMNGNSNRIGVATQITSTSNSYTDNFTLGTAKSASTGTFAIGQDITGTIREEAMYK